MPLREITPPPELAALLTTYEDWGGVVEHVLLGPATSSPDDEAHREAAGLLLAAVRERWRRRAPAVPPFAFDLGRARGTHVSPDEFFGPRDDEAPPLEPGWAGYAYAFLDPPYTLGPPAGREVAADVAALYRDVKRHLFGGDRGRLEVVSWSTDWSGYFDAGHEWWGAFLWTVYVPARGWIVAVGASTTD